MVHPKGYEPGVTNLTLRVCIDDTLPVAERLQIQAPVERAITTWNGLTPEVGTCAPCPFAADPAPGGPWDFETVVLHELGHCALGLAHVDYVHPLGFLTRYTTSTRDTEPVNTSQPGPDGERGSRDDIRPQGTAQNPANQNLHWFKKADNNPSSIATMVDATTYSRALTDLPMGDSYAASANREVMERLLGIPDTRALMYSTLRAGERNRGLTFDDVATVLYATSGVNELESLTADNYVYVLQYEGSSTVACANSDLRVTLASDIEAIGSCSSGIEVVPGQGPGPSHFRLIAPAPAEFRGHLTIKVNTSFPYDFGAQTPALVFRDGFESGNIDAW